MGGGRGLRDVESQVCVWAREEAGLELKSEYSMPSGNFILHFKRL